MSVTIHEILNLNAFSNFKLVAGANGLDRKVIRGGFIDHESPEFLKVSDFSGEMIFSSLPMIKGDPEAIVDYIKALIECDTTCFCLKSIFFDEFPQEAIEIANEMKYPLLIFEETYIEKLILSIDDCVNLQKKASIRKSIVSTLLDFNLPPYDVKKMADSLNPYIKTPFRVICFKAMPDHILTFDQLLAKSSLGKASLLIKMDLYYVLILSDRVDDVEVVLRTLGVDEHYYVGTSDIMDDIKTLNVGLIQSYTALKYTCYKKNPLSYYNQIGIYQYLIPLLDQPILSMYYERYINVLKEYDDKHQSDLLETACMYINMDGDIKATADHLFSHVNTIRYRIRKIKELFSFEDLKGMAYETLATAIHLYELNKSNENLL